MEFVLEKRGRKGRQNLFIHFENYFYSDISCYVWLIKLYLAVEIWIFFYVNYFIKEIYPNFCLIY